MKVAGLTASEGMKWLAYNFVAAGVGGYGIWCILNRKACVPAGRGRGIKTLEGTDAISAGVCYLLLATFAYVSEDWRERERLRRFRLPALILIAAAFACLVLFG